MTGKHRVHKTIIKGALTIHLKEGSVSTSTCGGKYSSGIRNSFSVWFADQRWHGWKSPKQTVTDQREDNRCQPEQETQIQPRLPTAHTNPNSSCEPWRLNASPRKWSHHHAAVNSTQLPSQGRADDEDRMEQHAYRSQQHGNSTSSSNDNVTRQNPPYSFVLCTR